MRQINRIIVYNEKCFGSHYRSHKFIFAFKKYHNEQLKKRAPNEIQSSQVLN
jgi:hypothetical protein